MPGSFTEAVEKKLKGFDPEGAGYDEETAAELDKLMPLTMEKPTKPPEDPSDYAYRANEGAFKAWVWHPKTEKEEGGWDAHGFLPTSSQHNRHAKKYLKGRTNEPEDCRLRSRDGCPFSWCCHQSSGTV